MRLLFRLFGFACLAAAFAALIVDGTTSVAANRIALHPLGDTLAVLSPEGFAHLHTFVVAKAPTLWDPVLASLFLLPTWAVLGVLGLLILALTRKPRPSIGYCRR